MSTEVDQPVAPEEVLAYESRVRIRQAIVAGAAGLALIVAYGLGGAGPHAKVNELTLALITANERFPLDLIAAILNGFAAALLAWTLVFLYRGARARSTQVRSYMRWLAIIGGALTFVATIVYGIVVAIKVHQFATTGAQTYDEARHVTSGAGLLVLQIGGELAALITAVAVVLVALQAMRVGLLTRPMGYGGAAAGALILFQILQVPIVQLGWLIALAFLFAGRWPGGLPAAWRTGRAEALPTQTQLREQRSASVSGRSSAGASRAGTPRAGGSGASGGLLGWLAGRQRPGSEPAEADSAPAANPRTRSATPKRKRKRRR
ncbi:MAG: hypothetical protein JOZ07_09285 [Solirubrobacterales bacterium]|nr:hypothetical protein [Solirubrobacterales bacterium]